MNADTSTVAARSAAAPSPPTAGRNRKAVWDLMDVDGKDVWCKRCGKLVHSSGRTHVERVEKHVFDRCVKRPSSYKITDIYQPKINSSVLKQFQERFAWWVYTTGMAFYKTEHHTLLEALQVLNPGISVPSSYQLANSLLDLACDKSVNRLTVGLCGRVVTLETDGWTDINGMAVINYMAVSGELAFFLESAYTGRQSHDTSFLVADVKHVLAKYKQLKFSSVITDNTPANKAMWEAMQSEYPQAVFPWLCLPRPALDGEGHARALALVEVTARRMQGAGCVFQAEPQVVVYASPKAQGEEASCARSPCCNQVGIAARLSGHCACCRVDTLLDGLLVSARNFLQAKKKSQRQKRKTVYTLVTGSDFVPMLKKGSSLLRVVANQLAKYEKNSTPISEVYKTFLDLPKEFEATCLTPREQKTVKDVVDERFEFVYGDAHGLA